MRRLTAVLTLLFYAGIGLLVGAALRRGYLVFTGHPSDRFAAGCLAVGLVLVFTPVAVGAFSRE